MDKQAATSSSEANADQPAPTPGSPTSASRISTAPTTPPAAPHMPTAQAQPYRYKPVRFYLIVLVFTWMFWFAAAVIARNPNSADITLVLMLLGLLVPSVTAICFVAFSKSPALKRDTKNKLVAAFRIKPFNLVLATLVFFGVIVASIGVSTLFGQSIDQFSFVAGFSFSIGGVPTLLTLVLTALLEELGWRSYAGDSIAAYCSWFKESVIFGLLWSFWHVPLFFIPDTYQYNILQESPWYMANFLLSALPMVFVITWVYVKNNRSILACVIFHFFVNLLQEEIAMTQVTKCVETFVLLAVVIVLVMVEKELFFGEKHVGRLLDES